jgi:predicted adenylyl cyclase CyaB
MPIEVEIRSFITKEQYEKLLFFFNQNPSAKLEKEDYQETFYFDCKEDLRIQKNNSYSKVWLKRGLVDGKFHDGHREEIELKFNRDKFEEMEKLFLALGYGVECKWFRKRHMFSWKEITVCLDYTRDYGYIIELEKLCPDTTSKEKRDNEFENLKKNLTELNIELTPSEVFEQRYLEYKKNWKNLVQ